MFNDKVVSIDDAIRGEQRAAAILTNPMYQDAYDKLRSEYLDQWSTSSTEDTEIREKLWLAVHVLDTVKSHFEILTQRGELRKKDLRELSSEKKGFLI